MNINHLLKDISIRHACKNVSKYLADVEKAIGIKLVPADSSSLEFTWSKDFEWYTDASDVKDDILDYFKRQKPKMFSVKGELSGHYKLYFTFKFHPENAV
jgi:hypothetical protein